jgi:hypothetical protein
MNLRLTPLTFAFSLAFAGTACVTVAKHPCTQGGQPAHDDGKIGKGTKQCIQQKDSAGHFINHGKYTEWYPNGQRAIEGEYLSGQKNGKWTEWDEKGRKLADHWYDNGTEVQGREVQPYNGLVKPPRALNAPATTLPTGTR